MADEIIEELWRIKDAIANEYGCDLMALVAHLRAKQQEEHKQVVHLQSIKPTAEPVAQPDRVSAGHPAEVDANESPPHYGAAGSLLDKRCSPPLIEKRKHLFES
jgi:hypothetical protein